MKKMSANFCPYFMAVLFCYSEAVIYAGQSKVRPCWCSTGRSQHEQRKQSFQIANVEHGKLRVMNLDLLYNSLTKNGVGDREVAVIGIVGVYRKGKSTLLNMLHRYLLCKTSRSSEQEIIGARLVGVEDWLYEDPAYESCSRLFETNAQSSTLTKGIWITAQPYVTKNVAIFLLDTQGLFDVNLNNDEIDSSIFYLASLLSSTLIVNVKDQLDSQLVNLLGALLMRIRVGINSNERDLSPNEKLFQQLLFVVRDHILAKMPLEEYYKGRHTNSSLHDVNKSFQEVRMSYLPIIALDPANLTFSAAGLNPAFGIACADVFDTYFTPDSIRPKTYFGRHALNGYELYSRFEHYATMFSHGKFMTVQDIYQKEQHLIAKEAAEEAFEIYRKKMHDELGPISDCLTLSGCPVPSDAQIRKINSDAKLPAVKHLKSTLRSTNEFVIEESVRLFNSYTEAFQKEQLLNATVVREKVLSYEKLVKFQEDRDKEKKSEEGLMAQIVKPFHTTIIIAATLVALYLLYSVLSCFWRIRPRQQVTSL